jgi:hypothetical protein
MFLKLKSQKFQFILILCFLLFVCVQKNLFASNYCSRLYAKIKEKVKDELRDFKNPLQKVSDETDIPPLEFLEEVTEANIEASRQAWLQRSFLNPKKYWIGAGRVASRMNRAATTQLRKLTRTNDHTVKAFSFSKMWESVNIRMTTNALAPLRYFRGSSQHLTRLRIPATVGIGFVFFLYPQFVYPELKEKLPHLIGVPDELSEELLGYRIMGGPTDIGMQVLEDIAEAREKARIERAEYVVGSYARDLDQFDPEFVGLDADKLLMVAQFSKQLLNSLEKGNRSEVEYKVYINNLVQCLSQFRASPNIEVPQKCHASLPEIFNEEGKPTDFGNYVYSEFLDILKYIREKNLNVEDQFKNVAAFNEHLKLRDTVRSRFILLTLPQENLEKLNQDIQNKVQQTKANIDSDGGLFPKDFLKKHPLHDSFRQKLLQVQTRELSYAKASMEFLREMDIHLEDTLNVSLEPELETQAKWLLMADNQMTMLWNEFEKVKEKILELKITELQKDSLVTEAYKRTQRRAMRVYLNDIQTNIQKIAEQTKTTETKTQLVKNLVHDLNLYLKEEKSKPLMSDVTFPVYAPLVLQLKEVQTKGVLPKVVMDWAQSLDESARVRFLSDAMDFHDEEKTKGIEIQLQSFTENEELSVRLSNLSRMFSQPENVIEVGPSEKQIVIDAANEVFKKTLTIEHPIFKDLAKANRFNRELIQRFNQGRVTLEQVSRLLGREIQVKNEFFSFEALGWFPNSDIRKRHWSSLLDLLIAEMDLEESESRDRKPGSVAVPRQKEKTETKSEKKGKKK